MLRIFSLILLGLLVACRPSTAPESANIDTGSSDDRFALKAHSGMMGKCYSLTKDFPATIKIDEDRVAQKITMQMKEPDGSWDTPEPMRSLEKSEAWQYYEVNMLGLTKDDIAGTVVREDGVMAISSLSPLVSSINPHLDSDYIVSLFGTVNTIYEVPCDDVPVDIAHGTLDVHGVSDGHKEKQQS